MKPALLALITGMTLVAAPAPAPKDHFGFDLGADGQMASWTAIVDYFQKLSDASDRVDTTVLGKTTLGKPFLLVAISAPGNLARKEKLAEISRRLADPRGLSEGEAEQLVEQGRSIVAVTASLHATELAGSQMTPLLAYRLATATDPETLRILNETVFLLFPCFNPDGLDMVHDWVGKTRGTKWEGSSVPDLYHHYAGHNANRDAYALNLAESRLFAQVVYKDWIPQLYLDIHQMGSYDARLYIPPYEDPIHPNVDPLVWMEHELVGAGMQIALERAGVTGVITGSPYYGWWFPSFHMVTNHHNIAGMLTETASARLAWPLYIHPHQLEEPTGRTQDRYEARRSFPHPWPGGWWRLRDLIHQQEVSTYAMLATAARNRDTLLRNMIVKARRSIERAGKSAPYAYIIRAKQHDSRTVEKLIGTLLDNGIEVQRAKASFAVQKHGYEAGDFIISLAQPNGVLAQSLLAEARHPDNSTMRRADGSILAPYDMANFVFAEHMGVDAEPVASTLNVGTELIASPPKATGGILGQGSAGWLFSHTANDIFRIINRLMASKIEAYRLQEPVTTSAAGLPPGALWVPARGASRATMEALSREFGVQTFAVETAPVGPALRLQPLRLGVYRRYRGGNMDEGWCRLLFDRWEFPYERVTAEDINNGGLDKLNVLLIPHDTLGTLKAAEEQAKAAEAGKEPEEEEYPKDFLPPEYRKGLDKDAMKRIRAFVRAGGGLVLLSDASTLAVEEMGLPVDLSPRNVPAREFLCPGSTLRVRFDVTHPLAFGMPAEGLVLNWGNPAFEVRPMAWSDRLSTPVIYANENLLKSGWLIGEKHLAGRPAAIDAPYGKGRIILIGFRSQNRAQTHGTFKVFFNALYYPASEKVTLGR